jgi:hypothetical protein
MLRRLLMVALTVGTAASGLEAGISVDAGLTPAQDRWIIRTMARSMRRGSDEGAMQREMSMLATPLVLAYGVRPDLTLMVREIFIRKSMSMNGNATTDYGRSDVLALGKYRVLRRNTRHTSLGVAAVLGLELPLGSEGFGSEAWDAIGGLNGSYRYDAFGLDCDARYVWNGIGESRNRPGSELAMNAALSYQFSLSETGAIALAPVLETGFTLVSPDLSAGQEDAATGERVFYLSPGAKLTISSVILEALVQIPVSQHQEAAVLPRKVGGLVGVRVML